MSAVIANGVAGRVGSILTVIPHGNIGGIDIQATLEERYEDMLEVTDHPVQAGAAVTDHSFMRPSQLLLQCGWSNSSGSALLKAATSVVTAAFLGGSLSIDGYVSGIYSQLQALQQSRRPFTIVTSIRQYTNMLMTSLGLMRDQKTSQALMVTAMFRQVIIVSTSSTTLPAQSNQANPQGTAETQDVGAVSTTPATPNPGGSASPSGW